MIKARLSANPKVLLVFDTSQSTAWNKIGVITAGGIQPILRKFKDHGIDFDDVSAVCLSDVVDKPKAADFKVKLEYIKELIDTNAFNLCVPIGATAFEKVSGMKGAAKYYERCLISLVHDNLKILPMPSIAATKYDPSLFSVIDRTLELIKDNKEYPEIREAELLVQNYFVLDNMSKVNKFFDLFMSDSVTEFAYDLETTGFLFNKDEITTIQFSHKPEYSYLIPCKTVNKYPASLELWSEDEWKYIVNNIKKLFSHKNKIIIGHNKKFDDKFIYHQWGVPLQKERSWCTMTAAFLCNENTPNGLKELACQYTPLGDYERPLEEFKEKYCKSNKIKKSEFSYADVPAEILFRYALADTDATIRLYHKFKEELVKEEQEEVFKLTMRIQWLFTRFELNGWPIDVDYGLNLKHKYEREIEEVFMELMQSPEVVKASKKLSAIKLEKDNEKRKTKLTELKDVFEFKFNSTPHKRVLFFDILGLPEVKQTKSKLPATDKEALGIWMRTIPKHKEFLQKVIHYGELTKFYSTYIVGILDKTINGRVHPTYSATSTKTARAACRNPNFMNLPSRGDERKMKLVKSIKRMVCAKEGHVCLGADLSAIEMRVAGIVSSDAKLIEIFREGLDIHGAIAKELFPYIECHPNEVKKKYEFERNSVSKTVQFLSLYGGGADKLAKTVNNSIIERQEKAKAEGKEATSIEEYTEEKAQQILDDYFKKYSGVDKYIKDTSEFALRNGYVKSIYGHKRRVPAVFSEDKKLVAQAVRQAVNMTVQNPASIALLLSLCSLQEEIDEKGLDIKLLGSIHDAGYCEVNKDILLEARDMLIKHMTNPIVENCPIPLEADAEWGVSWADFSDDFGSVDVEDSDEEDSEEKED